MKKLLIASLILIILASTFILFHKEASALPVSYNVTSLSIPWTTYTRAGANNFDVMTEAGYNGTVTSLWQGRTANSTLNWEIGYFPTLPLSLDTSSNITASASVGATQSISLTIGNNNNRIVVVGVSFEHTTNINHNQARMSSIAIGANNFKLALNKTVTCGVNACDSEIWYLVNPPTGAQTVTITPSNLAVYHMVAGAYSFYNV